LELTLTIEGRRGLGNQLYRKLREAILTGRLAPADRLPSSRELAQRLGVSRNIVNQAFERLAGEGYLEARVGSGTFVSTAVRSPAQSERPGARAPLRLTRWARSIVDPVYTPPTRDLPYDFRPGTPEVAFFPLEAWRRISARHLRQSARDLGSYGDTAGYPALRTAISRYLAHSRAVLAPPERIMITSGSQQALDLLARVLIEPGDTVVIEEPAYPAAVAAFRAAGARLHPVPVDDQGIRVDLLPDRATLAYVTPSHQFPLGVPLALPRRQSLLEWAARRRIVIVEDDYDSEFRYAGRPLESLQGLDRAGVVVYLGTFSKVLFPALRVGYLVVPATLLRPVLAAKWLADRHTPLLEQRILASFIQEGHFARHLRRMQKVYAERRHVLLQALTIVAPWITPVPSIAGLHLTAWLTEGVDPEALIARASATGVGLYSIAPFFQRAPRPGLIFGFGRCRTPEIREGVRRLRNVLMTMKPLRSQAGAMS
jgi:GntR family transcriptional regulator/MocR family aminotransferase